MTSGNRAVGKAESLERGERPVGKVFLIAPGIFHSGVLALFLFALPLLFLGCASNKAGMKSPELPAKHWLNEAPGVPVENREMLAQAVPNLYDPQKKFNFEECVYLAIQQSPLLVNSAVEIEIKKLALTDSVWGYLPEPRLLLTVTNNLTQYNLDDRDTYGEYGRTQLRVGFDAGIPNPVSSYFDHKVKQILLNLAISTHRKAVGEAIYKIAQAFLKLHAKREILATQKELLPLSKELAAYWQQVEYIEGKQGAQLSLARQAERESELTIEKTTMQEVMDRTTLKILAGVEPQQKMEIDTQDAENILKGFNGYNLKWENSWTQTEDDLLLRTQVKLADYNIMLAWAQYLPNMNIAINQTPPAGQAQPPHGREDIFGHLTFDIPLIDWGRRYRGVQTARMQKAEAFHEMSRQRTNFSNKWLSMEQQTALAATELKLQKTRYDTSKMQYEEMRISFDEGTIELPAVTEARERMVQAKINLIQAQLEYELAQLEWMYVANVLQDRFLGPPAREIEG